MKLFKMKKKSELAKHATERLICMGTMRKEAFLIAFNRIHDDLKEFTIINTRGYENMTKREIASDITNALLTENCLNEADFDNVMETVTDIIEERLKDYIVMKGEILE